MKVASAVEPLGTPAVFSNHFLTYGPLALDPGTRQNGGGLRWRSSCWVGLRYATGVAH
jgi:hypothetical protein